MRREGRHLTRTPVWPCRRVGRIRPTTTALGCGQVVRIRQVHRKSRIVIWDGARTRDSADGSPTVVEGAIAICGGSGSSSSVGLCSRSKDTTTCLRGGDGDELDKKRKKKRKKEKKKKKHEKWKKTYINHPIGDLAHTEARLGAEPLLLVLGGVGVVRVGKKPLLEELGDRLGKLSTAALLGGGERGHHVGGALALLGGTHRTPLGCGGLLRGGNGGWADCDGGGVVVRGHVAGGEHELLIGVVWAMRDAGGMAGDALRGGREGVPIGRRGRCGRRWGKGTPRGRWPGSGGRRRIGALVVVIEGELGTRATRRLGPIDRGELEGVEVLVGRVVPGAGERGRRGLGGGVRVGGGRGAEGRGGRWLGWIGKGVDWREEDVAVEGSGWLLVERGRIRRGLGVCAHPAEVVWVGWVHRGRGSAVVAGGSRGGRTTGGGGCSARRGHRGRRRGIFRRCRRTRDAEGDSDDRGQTGDSGDGGEEGAHKAGDGSVSQAGASDRQTDGTRQHQTGRRGGIIHSKLA